MTAVAKCGQAELNKTANAVAETACVDDDDVYHCILRDPKRVARVADHGCLLRLRTIIKTQHISMISLDAGPSPGHKNRAVEFSNRSNHWRALYFGHGARLAGVCRGAADVVDRDWPRLPRATVRELALACCVEQPPVVVVR